MAAPRRRAVPAGGLTPLLGTGTGSSADAVRAGVLLRDRGTDVSEETGGSATASGNIANSLVGVSATGGAGLVNGGNAVSQGGNSIALGNLIDNSVAGDGAATSGDAIDGNVGSAAAFGGDSVSSTTLDS
jgi:hypothetical protein